MFALLTVVSLIIGIAAFARINKLRITVLQLQSEINLLKQQTAPAPQQREQPHQSDSIDSQAVTTESSTKPDTKKQRLSHNPHYRQQLTPAPTKPTMTPRWQKHLTENWMTWLGGISVALAGVFMVRHSVAAGLLAPSAQILMALLAGLILHGAAYWLRQRNGSSDPAFAALAGGASITLYAALLAALHVYHLISPSVVFAGLAIVSLATVALALLHGPVLAMMGLAGAYTVPLLVNTGSDNLIAAMVYSLIISGSGLLLIRYVFRPWLWWSVLAGGLCWWGLSLTSEQPAVFRGLYLALLSWGILAIPSFNWLLRNNNSNRIRGLNVPVVSAGRWQITPQHIGLLAIIIAWGISITAQGHNGLQVQLWAPLVVIGCVVSTRAGYGSIAWITLATQWVAWLWTGLDAIYPDHSDNISALPESVQMALLRYCTLMALLYTAISSWQWYQRGFNHYRASLALLAPLIWLGLAYLQVNGLEQSLTWSLITAMLGLIYAMAAGVYLKRDQQSPVAFWLILASHGAYSLAATLYFREASLSLALSAQLVSLTWLVRRFDIKWLNWLVKLIMAVIVARLSLNPWLLEYPSDLHWSLWTYGGATLLTFLASRQCVANSTLRGWLEAATLQLLVMTLGTELRYWLYNGNIFASRYSLLEASINTSIWAALAMTYYYRARFSHSLARYYHLFSYILLGMALSSYSLLLTAHNPLWHETSISTTPVFNLLLLTYGLPVLLSLCAAYVYPSPLHRYALTFSGFAMFVFTTMEVRHLWQGGHISLANPIGEGELYSYSALWMLIAIAIMLAGTKWQITKLYKAGTGLLGIVIAKIFLFDMSGLDGLWRVAAFMGLGLSLLALAWFYRRMKNTTPLPALPASSKHD